MLLRQAEAGGGFWPRLCGRHIFFLPAPRARRFGGISARRRSYLEVS